MEHFHKHNHGHHGEGASVRTLYVCLFFNMVFVAIEGVVGWKSNSTGLLSDAGHNLSDALGLLLSLVAICLARTKSDNNQQNYRTKNYIFHRECRKDTCPSSSKW